MWPPVRSRRSPRIRWCSKPIWGSALLLQVADVAIAYGEKLVVHDVSLAVEAGEVVTLVGHNGAGKSTLLKAIAGTLPPRRGHIQFDGVDVTRQGVLDHLNCGVGFSPQGAQVFPILSVAD